MTTAFWQQDSEKVILSFLGPPGLNSSDVDVMVTQSSLRAGLRSTGLSVCDGSLFAQVKNNTAYYGIKTYPSGVTTVVLAIEKARPGEKWPTLFAEGAPENTRIFPVICTVKAFSEYAASDPSELSFPNEAVILILYQDPSGWWNGFYGGNVGNLPSNFVSVLPEQTLSVDVDDQSKLVYLNRTPQAGGGGGGGAMGGGMPGMGRGMGFGAGVNGELGNALKRRTQMLQSGASAPQLHRSEAEEEAEKARKAAEADALAQELARKQQEAMQAQAAAVASIPTVNNLIPGVTTVKATSPYDGAENELSFNEGDLIKVWQIDPSGWWEGECSGKRGWFPSNFVVLVQNPQPVIPTSYSTGSLPVSTTTDVLDLAIRSNQSTSTLRHSVRAKGPRRHAPTMHGIPKIQTWDSTEQSPEAGAAAAAAAAAEEAGARRPVGGVGMIPMPTRGLPTRGALRGAAGGPPRGGLPPRGGAGPRGGAAPRGGRGGALPMPRGGGAGPARGGLPRAVSLPEQHQGPKPPVAVRKAPPRPDVPPATAAAPAVPEKAPAPTPAAASAPAPAVPEKAPAPTPAAAPAPAHAQHPSSSSGAAASSFVTDPSKMTAPKAWSLPIPISDFCSSAAKLLKSLPAPSGNVAISGNLPDEGRNVNARALAFCSAEGQVFVAGENVACSAQGAVWPLLQAMLAMNVSKGLYANQPSDDNKVFSSAQNGCSISGAIAACSALIDQHPNEQAWDRLARITNSCSTICGCPVGFDMAVYAKTKKSYDAAWGTGYAMKGAGAFANNVADVMDLFFQLSSIQMSLPAAARMAAVLAGATNCSVSLPSKDEAVAHMRNYGLVNGVPVFGSESGLVIAAVPKVGGIAFWCPAVSTSSHIPVVSREFFKQLLEKYQV